MVRSTSSVRVLVAVAAVWHASALAPGAASPPAQLLPAVEGVHSNVLAHGGETAAPAAVAQEDEDKRVVGPDGGARGSGQRQHHQRAYVKGTARASGIADAAQATRSASAKGAQRWAFQLKGFANKVQNTSSTSAGVCNLHGLGGRWEVCS